jgi:hypothetical protein
MPASGGVRGYRPRMELTSFRATCRRLHWLALTALVVTGVGYGLATTDKNSYHVYPELKQAYYALDRPLPKTPEQAALEIKRINPNLQVVAAGSHAAAYQAVRHYHGGPFIAVGDIGRGHVELLGRHSAFRSSVVALDGTAHGAYVFKTLWRGQIRWGGFFRAELFALFSPLLLLFGAFGLDSFYEYRRSRYSRHQRRLAAAELARWQELVPSDNVFGPLEPRDGFKVWVAEIVEHETGDDRATFVATSKRWMRENPYVATSDYDWVSAHDHEPEPLAKVPIAVGSSVEDIAGAWADFCHQVAVVNASNWQAQQVEDQEQNEAEAARFAAKQEENERRELTRGDPLGQLLKPGPEMVRSLLGLE